MKTKIVRVSLTIRLPGFFRYIASEKDGVVWGFKNRPYLETNGWRPDLRDDCIALAYGDIVPNANWDKSLVYVENKKRSGMDYRIVLDIKMDEDAKYIFMPPPRTLGLVFASCEKPFMSKKYNKWLCIEPPTHIITVSKLYQDWKDSLRIIKERNLVK